MKNAMKEENTRNTQKTQAKQPLRAAVIGHPIAHSKSPLIHTHWLETYGIPGTYTTRDLMPEDLPGFIAGIRAGQWNGANVTVPHKERILPLCDDLDDAARRIGAVNTLVRREDGRVEGRNTDAYGFLANLKEGAPEMDLSAGPCVLLGAGGAARAVLYALLENGAAEIRVMNRTREKAEALADDFRGGHHSKIIVEDWTFGPGGEHPALNGASLLVNSTSLGMTGKPPLPKLDLAALDERAVVTDIVYAPLETDLLKDAAAAGRKTVTGIGMLLHQARPAFAAWTGVFPDVDADLLKKVLSA